MEIRRDYAQNKLFICQMEYVQKVLTNFKMKSHQESVETLRYGIY